TMSAQLAGAIAHAEATGALRTIGQRNEARFMGVPGSTGVGIGTCVVLSQPADLNSVPYETCDSVAAELECFHASLAAVREDVRALGEELSSRLIKEEQVLFDAYLGMLDDASLGREVSERIRGGLTAPYAWSEVILEHVKTFSSMSDPYLRERASDVRDLGSRVLAYLQQYTVDEIEYPENTVLVGEDLSAAMLAEVPLERVVAIVSLKGSSNSHIAIL